MKNNKIFWIAALLGTIVASCQIEIVEPDSIAPQNEEIVEEQEIKYTLTLEASKGVDTKALALENDRTLNSYWIDGEKVAVYKGGNYLGLLTATADALDPQKATLSGSLNSVEGVNTNDQLTLLFPRKDWDYTGQDGSVPNEDGSFAQKYDYSMATVQVATVEGNSITTKSGAAFENQQSVYRFAFKKEENALAVKSLRITSSHNALVQSRSWGSSNWDNTFGPIEINVSGGSLYLVYASLFNSLVGSPTQSQIDNHDVIDTYSFSIIGEDNGFYEANKGIPAQVMDVQGKFITAKNISVSPKSFVPDNSGSIDGSTIKVL